MGTHDGFEEDDEPGLEEVDQDLSERVCSMQMHLASQTPECSKVQEIAGGLHDGQGKEATQGQQVGAKEKQGKKAGRRKTGNQKGGTTQKTNTPGSSDMISALKGLSNMVVSFGGSEESVLGVDHTPRKRTAMQKDEPASDQPGQTLAIVPYDQDLGERV